MMKLKQPSLYLNLEANGKSSSPWEHKMFSYWPVRYAPVILSCVVFTIWFYQYYSRSSISDEPSTWDFLLFTQSYPVTCCIWTQVEKHRKYCHFSGDQRAWTVHGIWPTRGATEGPCFCHDVPFNASALEPILSELEVHWSSIDAKNGTDFWIHEWRKHGTCALDDKTIFDSEYTYFKLGLDWNNRYNVTRVLNEAGIIPTDSRSYSKAAFHDTIKSAWGKAPDLDCYYYEALDVYFIQEIRLCIDKNSALIDCDKSYTIESTCPTDGIMYPDVVVSGP